MIVIKIKVLERFIKSVSNLPLSGLGLSARAQMQRRKILRPESKMTRAPKGQFAIKLMQFFVSAETRPFVTSSIRNIIPFRNIP